ncbi:DUF559 domain-containing protein [Knoellia sp. CPCC 206453]|uniref:DUF559 domain-containing protein n=1 Tax=Knoellia pratensis TaxID=3404796 RepID=UPI003619D942
MSVALTLTRLGGCARAKELRRRHSGRALAKALRNGEVIKVGRGRYALPATAEHRRIAHARTGVLSHLSAAQDHGWKVKNVPERPQVTFPRTRRLRSGQREGIDPHWADLDGAERVAGVTSPLRTVLDCARTLPFDEALAVADSALRSGKVDVVELRATAAGLQGKGAGAARRVAEHADGRAANPLESVLRALCIEEGLLLTPQLEVADPGLFAKVDLGSEELRLIVEAEGYETHGTRKGLRRDCQRHSLFAIWGWASLRFSFEDVMFEQDWSRWVLRSWLAMHSGGVPASPPNRFRDAA